MDILCFCSVLCLLCLCARLFICALWSHAGKGLTSWLSFVVCCEFVTFPLVSWVWYLIVSIPDLCTLTYYVIVDGRKTSRTHKLYCYAIIHSTLHSDHIESKHQWIDQCHYF